MNKIQFGITAVVAFATGIWSFIKIAKDSDKYCEEKLAPMDLDDEEIQ